MAEMRRDPISGRWVVIATERAARPHDFAVSRGDKREGFCPFCEGNEDRTPPEIAAVRPDGGGPNQPGWRIRVVPNKYPALQFGAASPASNDFYEVVAGSGTHEVIIESPRHLVTPTEMSSADFALVVETYLERERVLSEGGRVAYVLVFKNVGKAAGASIEHSHSQLIALPATPRRVDEEMRFCKESGYSRGKCLFCEIIEHEIEEGSRVVAESEHFLAYCPFAGRFPFEMCILPKAHQHHFFELARDRVGDLARMLQGCIARLEVCLEDPPYNYLIHTAPVCDPDAAWYHWHIELIPRVTRLAGFEWGTGCYINPMEPERAAECLRAVTEEAVVRKLAEVAARVGVVP